MANKLLLVRHASTGPQWQGTLLGKSDVPIAADNHAALQALAAALRNYRIDACWCSPLLRTRQTAAALVETMGARLPAIRLEEDLRELDFGDWDGHRFAEIAERYQRQVEQWKSWDPDFTFPGGEGMENFVARIRRFSNRLAADEAETLLAITHGGVIRIMICLLLGLSPRNYLLFEVLPASLAVVELHSDGGVLTGLNLGLAATVKG